MNREKCIKTFTLILSFLYSFCFGYEIPDENEVTTKTCRLKVKIEVIKDENLDKPVGRAIVTAILTDDNGNPYIGERVELSANFGTFVCRLPEDSLSSGGESENDCFHTASDGKATVYLINIPYNHTITVRATYDCGGREIVGTASMSISKKVVKKKKK